MAGGEKKQESHSASTVEARLKEELERLKKRVGMGHEVHMSDHLNPNSPKTGTIATRCHSPRSVARRLWQSTFQRLWNRETPKNHGNMMLKAGEGCLTPLFQGVEGRGRGVLVKLRFKRPNEIEAHFKLLYEGVGGRVRV